MPLDYKRTGGRSLTESPTSRSPAPGKATLTSGLPATTRRATSVGSASESALATAVQRIERDSASGANVHAAAARGVETPASELPHAAAIQASFGPSFDVSGIQAHVGEGAEEACNDMGARGFAAGNHVAFAGSPDLHTAAHEAAHVAQQQRGVSLHGGLGKAGDPYEQHADQVADLVVQGQSAAHLIDGGIGSSSAGRGAVQRIISTDGLNQKASVVKQLIEYNTSLTNLLDGKKGTITKKAVESLEGKLNRIRGLLISKVISLSEEQRLPLKAAVEAELRELKDAKDDLQKLKALRASKPSLPGEPDNHGNEDHEDQVVNEDNPPVVQEDDQGGNLNVVGGDNQNVVNVDNQNVVDGNDQNVIGGGDQNVVGVDQDVVGGDQDVVGGDQDVVGVDNQDVVGDNNQNVVDNPELGGNDLTARTKEEGHTRIGFEIELGSKYTGSLEVFDAVDAVVNQTLFEFTGKSEKVILEMLLDDSKKKKQTCEFQVEFRTPPLELKDIKKELHAEISRAIKQFPAKEAFDSGKPLPKGWRRTPRCNDLINNIGDGALSTGTKFMPPSRLAQHVTSSINVSSYTKLSEDQQQLLYTHGKGSKTKIDLYKRILTALGSNTINATTTGRNEGKHLVKSPIESMLAAEEALNLQGSQGLTEQLSNRPRPGQVMNGVDYSYNIPDLRGSVNQIKHEGDYPTMQGQPNGTGYLAKAEKLQAPLLDPRNEQLRVLIEHRGDELCNALNEVLAGRRSELWNEFVEAVERMDKL